MRLLRTKREHNEHRLFEIVSVISMVFWTIRVISAVVTESMNYRVATEGGALLITVLLWVRLRKGINLSVLTKIYCALLIPVFIVNWRYSGGMQGPYAYAYFSIIVVYLGILQAKFRVLMVLLLCLLNTILTLDGTSGILLNIVPVDSQRATLAWSYLMHSSMVAAIVVFIKIRFDKERENIEAQNSALDRVNQELFLKHELLSNQQRQIKLIQNNLEELVHERTIELENKNKELQSYAYDNAHIVRRPLSNILSLLDLIKNESDQKESGQFQLKYIKKNALELDKVVRKINMILR